MLLGPLSDKFLCQNEIFEATLSLRQKKVYLVPFTEESVFPIYRENAVCTQKITWMPFLGGGVGVSGWKQQL